ncbi:MAG: tRNA1(Val) (adenine(37)-N6)-methyltransferase [Bacteroidaceae bacterium]
MANPYFQFKQFTVWHDRCAMKVGTDGALLGAWADVSGARRILDVGTGTGLVALMLAQRCPEALLTAVEIDADAAAQAAENVFRSPWPERIRVVCADFASFDAADRFDLIVSNPPYFVGSLPSPDQRRSCARHASALTYADLLVRAASLLAPGGRLALVLPLDVWPQVERIARFCRLHAHRLVRVRTTWKAAPKRVLVSLGWEEAACAESVLVVESAPRVYSPEFAALLKDFYLRL